MKIIHCTYPWLLVVADQEQGSRVHSCGGLGCRIVRKRLAFSVIMVLK